ncbi:hypothetical protein [uncultured Algimonas sp.]|uniref:hypothetical protein n=1 Tax=uncultured Algimonas sp. TaxID=1547920 RepID=UPI00262455EB|nr:hypothetical protein [uncultured Algimonas sp.]
MNKTVQYQAFIALGLLILSGGTAMAFDSADRFQFRLKAKVSVACSVADVRASPTGQATRLIISSSCNADNFRINLNASSDLDVDFAFLMSGGSANAVGQTVIINPARPGHQILVVYIDEPYGNLGSLNVSMSAM